MRQQRATTSPAERVEPQTTPTTSAEWHEFIAGLGRQREDAEARLEDLLVQRNDLALKLRLGNKSARQKADAIDAQVDRLKVEITELVAAVSGALEEARSAERAEKLAAEVEKAGQTQIILQERAALARVLDESLSILVAATDKWLQLSIALESVCPKAPARYIWAKSPHEMIACAHLPMRSALDGFDMPAGFHKSGGGTTKTWADLIPHVDQAAKAWAEKLLPLADFEALALAHLAAQEGAVADAAKSVQAAQEGGDGAA